MILFQYWNQLKEKVFKHPGGHERLPIEIARQVKTWKRPGEIFGVDKLMVRSKDNDDVQSVLTTNESFMDIKVMTILF